MTTEDLRARLELMKRRLDAALAVVTWALEHLAAGEVKAAMALMEGALALIFVMTPLRSGEAGSSDSAMEGLRYNLAQNARELVVQHRLRTDAEHALEVALSNVDDLRTRLAEHKRALLHEQAQRNAERGFLKEALDDHDIASAGQAEAHRRRAKALQELDEARAELKSLKALVKATEAEALVPAAQRYIGLLLLERDEARGDLQAAEAATVKARAERDHHDARASDLMLAVDSQRRAEDGIRQALGSLAFEQTITAARRVAKERDAAREETRAAQARHQGAEQQVYSYGQREETLRLTLGALSCETTEEAAKRVKGELEVHRDARRRDARELDELRMILQVGSGQNSTSVASERMSRLRELRADLERVRAELASAKEQLADNEALKRVLRTTLQVPEEASLAVIASERMNRIREIEGLADDLNRWMGAERLKVVRLLAAARKVTSVGRQDASVVDLGDLRERIDTLDAVCRDVKGGAS